MADTTFKGPIAAPGPLLIESGTAATIQPFDGLSGFYQGVAMLDPRSAPFPAEGTSPGRAPAFMNNINLIAVDNKPQATNATCVANSAAQTSLVAMPLATAQVSNPNAGAPFIAVGVPILPQGTTVIQTPTITLDFGFATGTTTANSSTVPVNDGTQFQIGQWIVIGGAANAAGSASLITQVQSITATTVAPAITVGPTLPATGVVNAPIGAANLFGGAYLPPATQFGPAAATANSAVPDSVAGLARIHNPKELLARNVVAYVGTASATVTFLVVGYDVWKQPMSELITIANANRAATSFFGKKAFKHITSITCGTAAAAQTATLGIGDVFGFPYRADEWEQTQVFWNGCQMPTSNGFLAPATTSPATNITGDVRGTIQLSTAGGGNAISVATAMLSNGTARLAVIQNIAVWNALNGTPLNTVPIFGVTNSTN